MLLQPGCVCGGRGHEQRGPLAPASVPEHFAGECQQVLDACDSGRAVPPFDGVSDVLERLRHSVSPHRRDLEWYQLRYCGVSVWELCWSCAVIHVRGVRGTSSKKVFGRVLHAHVGGEVCRRLCWGWR